MCYPDAAWQICPIFGLGIAVLFWMAEAIYIMIFNDFVKTRCMSYLQILGYPIKILLRSLIIKNLQLFLSAIIFH